MFRKLTDFLLKTQWENFHIFAYFYRNITKSCRVVFVQEKQNGRLVYRRIIGEYTTGYNGEANSGSRSYLDDGRAWSYVRHSYPIDLLRNKVLLSKFCVIFKNFQRFCFDVFSHLAVSFVELYVAHRECLFVDLCKTISNQHYNANKESMFYKNVTGDMRNQSVYIYTNIFVRRKREI